MKVKLRVSRAIDGGSQRPNTVIDIESAEGARMIAAGHAVAVQEVPEPKPTQPVSKPKRRTTRRKKTTQD